MIEATLLCIILILLAALDRLRRRLRRLQRDLDAAEQIIEAQHERLRFFQHLATGGLFGPFINSLDLDRASSPPGRRVGGEGKERRR